MEQSCNCVEHYCCGYEAGVEAERQRNKKMPEILLEADSLLARERGESDYRFEGYYDVIVYVPSDERPFVEPEKWRKLIEILIDYCGTNVSTLMFQVKTVGSGYVIGLKES